MGLDTVETILWAEQAFGFEIPDEDSSKIRTVGEFSSYIHHRLECLNTSTPISEDRVFESITAYLIAHIGVRPELIHRDAEFVKDLGLG
jgi:hypothetical protein